MVRITSTKQHGKVLRKMCVRWPNPNDSSDKTTYYVADVIDDESKVRFPETLLEAIEEEQMESGYKTPEKPKKPTELLNASQFLAHQTRKLESIMESIIEYSDEFNKVYATELERYADLYKKYEEIQEEIKYKNGCIDKVNRKLFK